MRRSWPLAVALAGTLASCSGPARRDEPSRDPVPQAAWVVDPRDPGPALPPGGRSLFDFLVTRSEGGRKVYDVPYPFAALTRRIAGRLGEAAVGAPLKMVLIPRGRSLQRDAARPDFFRFPRAVVAVDAEPRVGPGQPGVLLKDRLYLGYQEKANVIEVISYNEAAGRFEFQVVRDYREGGTPSVLYANRALCMTCHQNAAPIFARPLWDETNANPGIAALLAAERREFYGFPLEPGVDVPYLIDNATDRANLLSAWQLLWRDGCGGDESDAIRCRASLLTAALQYRLGGGRGFDRRSSEYRDVLRPALLRHGAERWPAGWRVPTADLPNRNPMVRVYARQASQKVPGRGPLATSPETLAASAEALGNEARAQLANLVRQSDVSSEFEPLLPREPLAVWPVPGVNEAGLERAVGGLSEFLADSDVRRLDARLRQLGATAGPKSYAAACTFDESPSTGGSRRVSFVCGKPASIPAGTEGAFDCEGRFYVQGGRIVRGTIHEVAIDGTVEMPELEIPEGALLTRAGGDRTEVRLLQAGSGLQARRLDGAAATSLVLSWNADGTGSGLLRTADDFAHVRAATLALVQRTVRGESDVLAARPFRRATVLAALEAELGLPSLAWCCEDATEMPPPALDAHSAQGPHEDAGTRTPARYDVFLRYCGRCHETPDRFPPNFLHGTPGEVEAKLAQCAERIYFRLGMWQDRAERRPKTPMPPENALQGLAVSRTEWPSHPDLRVLQDYAGALLRSENGTAPRLDALEARGYGSLRQCLPEGAGS
jgi:hypothetical protein